MMREGPAAPAINPALCKVDVDSASPSPNVAFQEFDTSRSYPKAKIKCLEKYSRDDFARRSIVADMYPVSLRGPVPLCTLRWRYESTRVGD